MVIDISAVFPDANKEVCHCIGKTYFTTSKAMRILKRSVKIKTDSEQFYIIVISIIRFALEDINETPSLVRFQFGLYVAAGKGIAKSPKPGNRRHY